MKIFYSYSHKDECMRDQIENHLTLLKDQGYIDEWHDRKIQAGQKIHEEIDIHLETSDIILLLLSPDFLASSECKNEMYKALELKKKNDTIVIPVIVRPCAWKDEENISDLQAIPTDGKPITQWENEDKAFLDIYDKIKNIIKKNPFRLKKDFRDEIIKIEFISQHKEDIKLDDLFVFPNIKAEYNRRRISGFEDFWKKSKHVILKGDDRIGKTVICRKLFLREVEKGIPTILISGNDITSPINHEQLIERKFREQYNGSYSHWKSKNTKLLIIDDFSHSTKLQFIKFAKEYFKRILIVVSEDEYLAYFKDEESFVSFELLTLELLGHSKQEELIKRWIGLSNEQNTPQEITHGKIDQIEDSLNSIILHNRIVPRYPFYILSILQTFEAFMPQSLQITAYGHCYQALITAQLVGNGIQKEDIDSSLNFLSHFAFEIFKRQGECSQDEFDQFLKAYNEQYIIKKSVINRLINNTLSIIRNRNGRYEFNYPFIYYFLLGSFFARHYKEHKNIIEDIAEQSDLKDNAYILIFTIHHTQDDALINTILSHTECAFKQACTATLSAEETKLLENALDKLPKKILSNRSIEEERRREREQRDKEEADLGSNRSIEEERRREREQRDKEEADLGELEADNDLKEDKSINDVYRSLKNMEILGQILRNKYGSLSRDKLKEVIGTLTDAGLRLINASTNRANIEGLEDYFIKVLDNANISEGDKKKIENFLRRQIRSMAFLIINGLLKKVVVSIRKPELLEVVEPMCDQKGTPAYDLIHIFFILDTSENLSSQNVKKITNILSKFEKSRNAVAKRLLSLAVQYYANTHEIDYKLRGKIFQALSLKYQPNPLERKRLR